ncbi:DUF6527 family protein [Pseudomonas fluvialis]|uniref:DUF6527 family protein n=1 Tax=Pseudomonas fluvialis TaxID=1793966 RepID=UPI001C86CBE6
MLKHLIRSALVAFRVIPSPRFTLRTVERHPAPNEISADELVLVKSGGQEKWACFICPCGCGNRMQLSLNPKVRPNWRVLSDWLNRPTIHPSIRQLNACWGHYWIRSGEVDWCADTGRESHSE